MREGNIRIPTTAESEFFSEKEARIDEFLTRGVDSVYPSLDSLRNRLLSGDKLTAYMGIDPTAPEMHVGHMSQLFKLRRLQQMGHTVILLIGDFTAQIGDPTDKSAARVKLTHDQVLENAASYRDQAAKILDFDDPKNPVQLKFNSEWLGKMGFADVVELASEVTVQQLLQREMFQRRMNEGKPIHAHEFLYPLMQGWDSVAMGVDIEIGGSDQIFNMLIGRDLVKTHLGKEKYVVAGDLLVDPSGKKIGKTEGNMITLVDEPGVVFEKVMKWGDAIVPHALELCTTIPMEQVKEVEDKMRTGELDGLSAKKLLARTIVEEIFSPETAEDSQRQYEAISAGDISADITKAQILPDTSLIDVIVSLGFASSKGQARRLIEQGGVRINGNQVKDIGFITTEELDGSVIQVGKKTKDSYRRLVIQKFNSD